MKIRYHVEGLDCPNCAARLEKMLNEAEGITSAKINFLTEKITVQTDLSAEIADERVASAVRAFGKGVSATREK